MFNHKVKAQTADSLPVTVHAVRSAEAFSAAQKVWTVNARTVYADQASGKELLHFALGDETKTVMWLQRDSGRADAFELIVCWRESKTTLTDIHVLLPGPEKSGDDTYVRQVLEGLLTTPATVPVAPQSGAR